MASIIIYMFSYDSSLCTEWRTGISRVLPLWRRTALWLNLEESKESSVQRIVINIECLHQTINISASNKAPFPFSRTELDLRVFYNAQKSLLVIWERSADTCIPSQVTILRIKPHFMYHDN